MYVYISLVHSKSTHVHTSHNFSPPLSLCVSLSTQLQPILIEVAALISLGLGDYPDFGIICGLLLANACLGFREEYHAKKSLDELSDQLESEIAVRREGTTTQMNVKELVPGDVVLLVGGTSELICLLVLHREDLPILCQISSLTFHSPSPHISLSFSCTRRHTMDQGG